MIRIHIWIGDKSHIAVSKAIRSSTLEEIANLPLNWMEIFFAKNCH